MPAYHITGPSGSGKSTLGQILQSRDFLVVEADFESGLSSWVHHQTKKKVYETPPYPFPESWILAHHWEWDEAKIREIIAQNNDVQIFVVGGAFNEKDVYHLFEKRFGLFIDDTELVKRLQGRDPKRWVDGSTELKRMLEWNAKSRAFNEAHGAISIDSSRHPEIIADSILEHISYTKK